MKLLRTMLVALQSLRANKMRSLLTMLGIIIGVAAVITMVGIGDGAKANISQRIKSMGTNLLTIRPGQQRFRRVRSGSVNTLTLADAEAIKRQIFGITAVSPEVSSQLQLKYKNKNVSTVVLGATDDYTVVNNFKLKSGRFFNASDVRFQRKVVVMGAEPASQLFGNSEPIGKEIKIKGMPFTIIGLLEAKGSQGWSNPDDQVIIPLTVAQKRLFGVNHLRSINVSVTNERDMELVQSQLTILLRSRHRIKPGGDPDFYVRNQKEMLKTFGAVTETMSLLLASIAAVSMIVGGIGIMNIMLVSVTERTREIGVRKAVGANTFDIMIQFMIESIVISVLGGLIGVLVGIGATNGISSFGSWNAILSAQAVMISFAFAVAVGLFFGIYPARRASSLNPIEALRYE